MYLLLIILLIVLFTIHSKSEQYYTYDNICLTNKPLYHTRQVPGMTYWKNLIRDQKKQIKQITNDNCIEGVMSSETECLGKTKARGEISVEYYKNPVLYCKLNPDQRPCPNHWLVQKNKNLTSM